MRINMSCHMWKRSLHQKTNSVFKWKRPIGFDTGISVYNFIEKKKVPLILKNKNIAKWYMCGPTVYESAHIGHAW